MSFISLLTAFLLPLAAGFLICCLLLPGKESSVWERLFLGYGLGMGLVTFLMFILGLLQIRFSFGLIISIVAMISIILVVLANKRASSVKWDSESFIKELAQLSLLQKVSAFIISSLILLKVVFVILESTTWPVHAWDSWEIWSLAGKFFYSEGGLALDPASEYYFGKGYRKHMTYPLHVPLLHTWVSLAMGGIHEIYIKVWNAFYFISIIGLFFSAIRKETSLLVTLVAVYLLSSVPLMSYHSITAYADLSLAYYALASAFLFWKFTRCSFEVGSKFLFLTGLFTALCMWTKLEGIFYVIAFLSAILLYILLNKLPLRRVLVFAAPIIFLVLIWYGLLFFTGTAFERGEGSLGKEIHLDVLPVIWGQIIYAANFNIIFPFFFFILIVAMKTIRDTDIKYLLLIVLLVMLQFLVVYVASDNYIFALNLTAINRNILSFIPMLYFAATILTVKHLEWEKTGGGS